MVETEYARLFVENKAFRMHSTCFPPGFFYCFANFCCYANFSIVFGPNFRGGVKVFFGGGGELLERVPSPVEESQGIYAHIQDCYLFLIFHSYTIFVGPALRHHCSFAFN